MENQKSQLSPQTQLGNIPAKWKEKFVLKRIDEEDIVLSLEERNGILQSLNKGDRFVQIRKHTLMLNSIKSIDPYWGERNVPPRPLPSDHRLEPVNRNPENDIEGREWDKYFGKEKIYALSETN